MATLRQAQDKLLTLQVSRTPPTAAGDRWQSFDVPYAGQSMSLLDGLIWIQRNSDPTAGVPLRLPCGYVRHLRRGGERQGEGLACRTMARDLLDGGARVEPMRHMPGGARPGDRRVRLLCQASAGLARGTRPVRWSQAGRSRPGDTGAQGGRPAARVHLLRPVLLGLRGGGTRRGLSGSRRRSIGPSSPYSTRGARPRTRRSTRWPTSAACGAATRCSSARRCAPRGFRPRSPYSNSSGGLSGGSSGGCFPGEGDVRRGPHDSLEVLIRSWISAG